MSTIFENPFMLSSLNGTNGFTASGSTHGYDRSVASAGDINGDGIEDFVIGSTKASPGGRTEAGASYVVFGKNSGWNATLALIDLDGSNGFVINGVRAGDLSGTSVASAGDINGDGVGDLIIGAPLAAPEGRNLAGSSYVIFGKTTPWPPSLELSDLNGSNGCVIGGVLSGDTSGNSVASAGDFNGDGIDDIIIGASGARLGNKLFIGASYVVFGKRNFWSTNLALSSLNGSNGLVLKGVYAGDGSGKSVASADDFNGDGIGDIIIGAPDASTGTILNTDEGAGYVVFGKQTPWSASFELSSLNGLNGLVIAGRYTDDSTGCSVASAGDINRDSIGDLIIGACNAHSSAGTSYVVFGRKEAWTSYRLGLYELDGNNGFALNGVAAGDQSGSSVASAGDVDNDGIDDLIIGSSSKYDSYVVYGKQKPWGSSLELSTLNGTNGFVIKGAGSSVAAAGDINKDGISDIILAKSYSEASYVVFGKNGKSTNNEMSSTAGIVSDDSSTGSNTDTISSTGSNAVSSATRNKPWVLSAVQGTVSSIGYLGTELLSRMNPFRLEDTVEIGKTENVESSGTPTSSTDNSNDDSGSRPTMHSNGFKIPTLSMNDYLSIIPYVTHYARKYSPFTLPWNKVRTLSNAEIKAVDELQNALKASVDARQNQTTSRAVRSGMFADRSHFIDTELQTLRAEIIQILTFKQASSSQLTGIKHGIQRVDERIHELSKLNKSLKHLYIKLSREERRRPHHQTLSQIHHDPARGTLKQRFIQAESREGIELVMNSTKSCSSSSSKTLLFSSKNIVQSQAQKSASQSFLENIPARKAVGC